MTSKQELTQQTTDDFDPAILIGKRIDSLVTLRKKDEPDFIRIRFSDSSSIEFYLNKNPDIFYMEPEQWSQESKI